jgi:hypothetical protein
MRNYASHLEISAICAASQRAVHVAQNNSFKHCEIYIIEVLLQSNVVITSESLITLKDVSEKG